MTTCNPVFSIRLQPFFFLNLIRILIINSSCQKCNSVDKFGDERKFTNNLLKFCSLPHQRRQFILKWMYSTFILVCDVFLSSPLKFSFSPVPSSRSYFEFQLIFQSRDFSQQTNEYQQTKRQSPEIFSEPRVLHVRVRGILDQLL